MKKPSLLAILILLIVAIFTAFTPAQLINSDSVSGFDALKGYGWTGQINAYFIYDQTLHRLIPHFLTWWSPGQYAMPWLLMKFFGLSLGSAVTLLNSLCLVLGAIGYGKVFRKFQFSPTSILLSVLLILFSGATLSRYYSYQGGESLNFALFPWIILLQPLLVKKYLNFILPGLLLLLAFFFKLQLLIIVPPLLLLLSFTGQEQFDTLLDGPGQTNDWWKTARQLFFRCIPAFISIACAFALIYEGFISKGATPASGGHLSFKPMNLMVPFASPLTSFYAFESGFDLFHRDLLRNVYLLLCCIIVLTGLLFIGKKITTAAASPEKKKYALIVFLLFLFSFLVFSVLYSQGTNIDYNTRHFKLVSFLLYPLLCEALLQRFGNRIVTAAACLLILVAAVNHVRLTRIWLRGTAVTASNFRLLPTDMPLAIKRQLDTRITSRTIVVSPYESRYAIDNPLILPVTADSGTGTHPQLPDMGYPVIYVDPSFNR